MIRDLLRAGLLIAFVIGVAVIGAYSWVYVIRSVVDMGC